MMYDTPILIDVIDIVANALTALQNNENISSSKAGKELYGAVSKLHGIRAALTRLVTNTDVDGKPLNGVVDNFPKEAKEGVMKPSPFFKGHSEDAVPSYKPEPTKCPNIPEKCKRCNFDFNKQEILLHLRLNDFELRDIEKAIEQNNLELKVTPLSKASSMHVTMHLVSLTGTIKNIMIALELAGLTTKGLCC